MKQTAITQKKAQTRVNPADHDISSGPTGVALAPPTYGMVMVNRQPVQRQALPVDVSRGAVGTPQNMPTTGLPDHLKAGIEALSGLAMDDVQVHYNSAKPAKLQALAYTQGANIYIGPGQEQYLPHEAWHVVQQKQGQVWPTLKTKGMQLNNDPLLEHKADVMGQKAVAIAAGSAALSVPAMQVTLDKSLDRHSAPSTVGQSNIVQCKGGKGRKGAQRWTAQAIEEGMEEVYDDWDEDWRSELDEEEPILNFREELAAAVAARTPARTERAITELEATRVGPEADVRNEAQRFGNEFRRLIHEATHAANEAVDLSVRAGIVAGRLGAQGQESQAMARTAETSAALASIQAQDATESESLGRATTAHRLAMEAKRRATWAMARARSNVAKMEAQRESVIADTVATVAETTKTINLVRRMMGKAKPKDQSILDQTDKAEREAKVALSKARGARRLDAAENAFDQAASAQQLAEEAKVNVITLLKRQKAPRPAVAENDILAGPQWLRDYEATQRRLFMDKQRTASSNVTNPALRVNESLTILGHKVLQWYQEVTKQKLPGFYSTNTADLTAGGRENLAIGPNNWLDVWSKLRRREQASNQPRFRAVNTLGSSFPLIGQVGLGGKSFSVETKLWVKPTGVGTASRYHEMATALAADKSADVRAANIRKVLSGDLTGVDAHETEAALAMFGSEVARNPRSYGVGLMLLDLVENQARYGKNANKQYTWDKILASHQHIGENQRVYEQRKTSATSEKQTRWDNFTRALKAQAPPKFQNSPMKTLWAGKWPMSPAASMSLGESQSIPGTTAELNVVQYREMKTILNWYIFMMKGEPLLAKSEAEAETQLKAIFRQRLGNTAKTTTLAADW